MVKAIVDRLPLIFIIIIIGVYIYGIVLTAQNYVESKKELDQIIPLLKETCCPPNFDFFIEVCKFYKSTDDKCQETFRLFDDSNGKTTGAVTLLSFYPIFGFVGAVFVVLVGGVVFFQS